MPRAISIARIDRARGATQALTRCLGLLQPGLLRLISAPCSTFARYRTASSQAFLPLAHLPNVQTGGSPCCSLRCGRPLAHTGPKSRPRRWAKLDSTHLFCRQGPFICLSSPSLFVLVLILSLCHTPHLWPWCRLRCTDRNLVT
jgi:hypothetical protein